MKINVSYKKLPDGKIHAFILVADKGEYLTDRIFMRNPVDVSEITAKSFDKYPLQEREVNYACLISDNENIVNIVDIFVKSIKQALKDWKKLEVPKEKEYSL